MRSLFLLLSAVALSAETPPPELQRFEAAMQALHYKEAAAVIDDLIEQRTPEDGQPHRDALLNSLLGRLAFAGHEPVAATPYLARAPLNELPASLRGETALAYGRVLELQGKSALALQAYRDAAAAGGTEIDRRKATLGIARQLLIADPVAAREQVLGIANGPPAPDRWEARYLLSLTNSLLGDAVSAVRLADEAWADSANAPLAALAPLHVATLKAGLAAARHDLAAERTMLIATNGLALNATTSLSAQLPVCGDDGVGPADFVIFGIVAGPYGTRDLMPIAASRAEAVAPFHQRLAGFSLLKEADGRAPVGTVVRVACRGAVHAGFLAKPTGSDPLFDWFVDRGLYPARATNETDDQNVNAAAARIETLKARFGGQSILLIEPRWQLLYLLETRVRAGDQLPAGQLTDLRKEIADGLRRAGAPPWLAQAIELQSQQQQIQQTAVDPAEAMNRMEAQLRDQIVIAPFDLSRSFMTEMLDKIGDEDLPAPASRLVLALNAQAPKTLGSRERQAWSLTVARAQRSLGLEREARATLAAAGIGNDLCAAADTRPSLLEQHFTYEDYPEELIAGEQEGAVLFGFDALSTGALANPRIIYSLPAGLFDQASAKGIATVRYTPAVRAGKPVSCRGLAQPVIWKLEEDNDFRVPSLAPQAPIETT
jgi:hypothetical protein